MTTSRATTGADVIWNSPGHSSGPTPILTSPLMPKSAQGVPDLASSAITRASLVPMKMRARQAALSGGLRVDPIGDAAAIVAIGRALCGRDFRIVPPFRRAAARIERDHLVERRAEDQAVLDQQRRGLKLGPLHHLGRAGVEIAGAEFPGADEIADIVRRDLIERRKPRSAGIAAPMLPSERRKRIIARRRRWQRMK